VPVAPGSPQHDKDRRDRDDHGQHRQRSVHRRDERRFADLGQLAALWTQLGGHLHRLGQRVGCRAANRRGEARQSWSRCDWVAEVATARSRSAVFSAVIDATTSPTPMQATARVQFRARRLPPMLVAPVR